MKRSFMMVLMLFVLLPMTIFAQSSDNGYRVPAIDFKEQSTAPNAPKDGYKRLYKTTDGYKYKAPDNTVVTVLDSVNSEDIVLSAHQAISVNSTSYTLNASGKVIITLTGTASGKKITTISNGADGQRISLHFGDGNVTVDSGAAKLTGGVDFLGANHDVLDLEYNGTEWREISRQQQTGLNGVLGAQTAAAATVTTFTASGAVAMNGGITCDTNKFTIADSSGNFTSAGTGSVAGKLTATVGVLKGIVALTPSSTISLDPTLADVFTLTPGQDETINAASVPTTSQEITIHVLTSGTTSRTLTFGTNFKSTGTLATGTSDAKKFTIRFQSDGTTFNEISRTTAQ